MSTSPIAGSRIVDINFPEGVIVGGILKDGEMLKPDSSSKIEEGDVIALFVLSKIFLKSKDSSSDNRLFLI